jgi:hypothetical protein
LTRPLVKTCVIAFLAGWIAALLILVSIWWATTGALFSTEKLAFTPDRLFVEVGDRQPGPSGLVVRAVLREDWRPAYLAAAHGALVWTGASYEEVHPFEYAVCDCRISGADASARFVWQNSRIAPAQAVPFTRGTGAAIASPSASPAWQGTVFAFGIEVTGGEDSRIAIDSLQLRSDSAWMRLRSAWAQWTAFQPWDMTSINTVRRNTLDAPSLSSMAIFALVLTILFLLLATRGTRTPHRTLGVLVLVGAMWFLLDVRWFFHLARQGELTLTQFAGKSVEQRVAAELYAPIVDLSYRIKRAVGAEGAAVFMMTDQPDARYLQERLAFELYPLNVFNFKRRFYLARQHVRPGDHILLLEQPEPVSFDEESGELRWEGKGGMCVVRVMESEFASLYRVCAAEDR